MDYKLVTRGFTSNQDLQDYVDKKSSKLEKVLPEGDHVHGEVKIERENKDFRAEITVHIRKAVIRTEEITSDIYASVDNAIDAMEKKLEKYKNKRMARHRNAKATS
jgi:putative sigma-54 modulation protein